MTNLKGFRPDRMWAWGQWQQHRQRLMQVGERCQGGASYLGRGLGCVSLAVSMGCDNDPVVDCRGLMHIVMFANGCRCCKYVYTQVGLIAPRDFSPYRYICSYLSEIWTLLTRITIA
jgi:hypothetical protein